MLHLKATKMTKQRRKSETHGAAWGRRLCLLLLLTMTLPAMAAGPQQFRDNDQSLAGTRKMSTDLRKMGAANPRGLVTVIVQFKSAPDSATVAGMRTNGRTLQRQFSTIRALTLRLPASMVEQLANDPRVSYVTPDRSVKLTSSDEDYTDAVESDLAAAQFAMDGTSVGVAVIDSGISDHADLHKSTGASRVVYSESFVVGDISTADGYGHGTHVAGLIGGNGASSALGKGYPRQYSGMAPGVNLINLRVLDANGAGTDSQVIAAIQRAIALKSTYNIRVINLSLGRRVFES